MREVASTSADGDHSEPQEFQDQETVTENRHTNYGMHELPPLEPKKGKPQPASSPNPFLWVDRRC